MIKNCKIKICIIFKKASKHTFYVGKFQVRFMLAYAAQQMAPSAQRWRIIFRKMENSNEKPLENKRNISI